MVGAVLGLVAANSLVARSPAGIAVQVAALALMAWARLTFGRRSFHAAANPTAGGLVTTGPYRFIRHPIYASACLFVWMLCEERLVVAAYPEYREYARTTRRIVPYVF